MKKFLLILTAVFGASLPTLQAQTGSTVREDRVWTQGWHSYHNELAFDRWNPTGSYHFEGTCDNNGRTYMILLNEDNEQEALLRQEGGKVYRCADDNIKEYINWLDNDRDYIGWTEESKALWDQHSGEFEEEVLLYDFEAKPGDKYLSLAIPLMEEGSFADSGFYGVMEVEVMECYTINVNGSDYRCQVVCNNFGFRDRYIIVEGIGCGIGGLISPMFEYPENTGFTSSEAIMYSVADNSGNTLFEYKDFSTDHVGVPQCRGWEYVYAHREGDTVSMTMFYMGNMDKSEWPYESKITTWSYAFDELTGELVYNQDKQTADSFMRTTGEWGDYTSQNGLLCFSPSITTKESLGLIEDNALLLYDFNAKEGDKYESFRMEQTLDGQPSDPFFDMVTVLETGYTEIDHQNCRVHKITCGGREYSIIEGIGSEETGLMPYSNVFDSGKGICSGFRLNRVFNIFLNRNEENVIFYSPNYIDVSNLGNTDGVESMFAEELGLLRYDNGNIYADGLRIIIYDVNGMIAAEGFGEVSTENLQPGVYVARSGTETLKIFVR